MDASKDILIHPVLGRIDQAKGIEVVIPVAPTPSGKSIGLPIASTVLRGDDASVNILQCDVRFDLEGVDTMGASGKKVLLNEKPEVSIRPKAVRFKGTRLERRTPI